MQLAFYTCSRLQEPGGAHDCCVLTAFEVARLPNEEWCTQHGLPVRTNEPAAFAYTREEARRMALEAHDCAAPP